MNTDATYFSQRHFTGVPYMVREGNRTSMIARLNDWGFRSNRTCRPVSYHRHII